MEEATSASLRRKKSLGEEGNEKNIAIEIPDLDPTKVLVFPISPDQLYHNGEIFSAALEYLEAQGVKVHIMLADDVRRYTFQLEQGKLSPDQEVQNAVKELEHDWQANNLLSGNSAPIYQRMCDKGMVGLYTWKHWRIIEPQATHVKEFLKTVQCIYEEKSGFYKSVEEAMENFYAILKEKHKNNNRFVRLCKFWIASGDLSEEWPPEDSGVEGVKQTIRKYIFEECAVMLLWQSLGYTQMAYPINYNGDGKGTNRKVFNCVTAIFKRLNPEQKPEEGMRLLDIKITQQSPKKKPNPSLHPSLKYTMKPRALFPDEASSEAGMQTELGAQLLQLKADHLALAKEKAELQTKNSQQEITIKKLSEQNAELQTEVSVQSEVGVMNAGLQQILQQLAEQNASLQTVVSQQTVIIEKLTAQNEKLHTRVDDLTAQNEKLHVKVDDLTAQIDEMQEQQSVTMMWVAEVVRDINIRKQSEARPSFITLPWSKPPYTVDGSQSSSSVPKTSPVADSTERVPEEAPAMDGP